MQAFDITTGERVNIGDRVADALGVCARLVRLERATMDGSDGKVAVMWPRGTTSRSYDARVFGLRVTK